MMTFYLVCTEIGETMPPASRILSQPMKITGIEGVLRPMVSPIAATAESL